MQTHKKSLLHKLLILIITLMISMFVLPTFVSTLSTTVHAESYDFDEGDPAAKGSASILGGPSWSRSGVVFYLVDEFGKYAGAHPIAYTTMYDGIVDRNNKPLTSNNIRLMTRKIALNPQEINRGAIDLWGPPWDNNGNYRGVEIREWLLEHDVNGHTRAANLIKETWGEDYAMRWEDKELFLVFESFGWNNVYCKGINTGACVAGTASSWAGYLFFLHGQGLVGPSGDPKINRYTNNIYQHCMILTGAPETDKMEFRPAPTRSGIQPVEQLRYLYDGYGTGVVWNEPNPINTYDEAQGSPGPAEDPMPDKIGTKYIVKGYYTENEDTGEKTSNGVFIQEQTSHIINIMDEPEYEIVSWDMSRKENPGTPDPTNWKVPQLIIGDYANGTEPATVEIPRYVYGLYVLLKRVESEDKVSDDAWILEESEITKSVETGDKIKNQTINITLPNLESCKSHTKTESEGCDSSCEPGCPGGHTKTVTYHCDSWSLSDKKVSLITINTNEDNTGNSLNVLAKQGTNFITEHEKTPANDNRASTKEETLDTKGYNYKFVIHRFNKDKLSLLKYEPSPDDLTKIQSLGSMYDIKTLETKERKTRKSEEYIEKLKLILEIDEAKSADKSTTVKGNHGCTKTGNITSYNNNIEFEGDVTIKTYRGEAREPDTTLNTTKIMSIGTSGFNTSSGRMIQSGGSVTFNPFIKMTYQTLDSEKQEVYVISEWIRQVIPNDYAEISWNKSAENLRLTSNQWSTHADALRLSTEIHGSARTNCMLPGGAVYSLDMKDSSGKQNSQIIQLKTYQTIVEGKAREYSNLASDTTELTEAIALDEHKAFAEGAAATIEGTSVEMWVHPDPTAASAWSSGGIKVGSGSDISKLNNGSSTSSTDSKYYLTADIDNRKNVSRSDLDTELTHKPAKYHRIWSDTSGNIRYASGNSLGSVTGVGIEGGNIILTKGQDASALSGEIKNIDNRTKFVTKYVAAVERNTGNDSTAAWASDGKWYNEAYYGIIVVEQTSQIEVKFYATDMRTTIMDPKLVPKINKKNEPMKAFLFQYKTALPTNAPITSFKGKAIYMNNADLLFSSQKAYIISQTVQDLS